MPNAVGDNPVARNPQLKVTRDRCTNTGFPAQTWFPLLGTSSRVSEVLNGKRQLSLTIVNRLRERFNISADLLISRGQQQGRRIVQTGRLN
jgi:antitoxin component HigA of HigAB toxin-antitoxin module